jgi:hypothetical protein
MSLHGGSNWFILQETSKEERTDEILRGDFMKFCGSLDLAEVQGGYDQNIRRFKAQKR